MILLQRRSWSAFFLPTGYWSGYQRLGPGASGHVYRRKEKADHPIPLGVW